MKIFSVKLYNSVASAQYFILRADAHAAAKLLTPREDVEVKQLDIPTDMTSIQHMMNGQHDALRARTVKTFKITTRGALKEDVL